MASRAKVLRRLMAAVRYAWTTGTSRDSRLAARPIEAIEGRVMLASIYLDFYGDPATTWNNGEGDYYPHGPGEPGAPIPSYSHPELVKAIQAIVAEKYKPFNIDVTTVDPGTINHQETVKVVIGGRSSDWYTPKGDKEVGGVSAIGGFYNPNLPNTCYVFEISDVGYMADAITHEVGHEFGLWHQSVWSGTHIVQVYNDNNTSTTKETYAAPNQAPFVTPIMGSPYYGRAVWWWGTNQQAADRNGDGYPLTTSDVLDLAKGPLNGGQDYGYYGAGFRPDDHGNSASTATAISQIANSWNASDVIEQLSDVDYFSFTTSGGTVTFTTTVPSQGAMLNPKLQLFDATGNELAAADVDYTSPADTYAGDIITETLDAGTYYLAVRGHGLVVASDGYYADIGGYKLTGTFVAPADITPPRASLSYPANGSTVAQSTINADPRYMDVTFSDLGGSGLNLATITDSQPEFSLSGSAAGGVLVSGSGTLVSGTTYRYTLSGGGFGIGSVSVNFIAGSWADNAPNLNRAFTQTFTVTGSGDNAPTISAISDQTTLINTPLTLAFTVGDDDTPASSLQITCISSDQAVIPSGNIVAGGRR